VALTGIVYPALFYGALISLVMTVMILITFRWNPEIWVHDAPPKIRERYGPVSAKAKRDGRIAAVPTFILLVGILVLAVVDLHRRAGSEPGFWAIFLTIFIAMQTFNVFDLLVLDWLILATFQPKSLMIPGTETWEGHGDYAFHFRGFLIGCAGITVVSVVCSGAAMLIASVFTRAA
jgi:hypothetical protein